MPSKHAPRLFAVAAAAFVTLSATGQPPPGGFPKGPKGFKDKKGDPSTERLLDDLTLTDAQPGKHKIRMSMSLDPTNPVELLHREFESQSPLHRINLINELRNLRFDQPGDYSILIEVDDEPILATSLTVS